MSCSPVRPSALAERVEAFEQGEPRSPYVQLQQSATRGASESMATTASRPDRHPLLSPARRWARCRARLPTPPRPISARPRSRRRSSAPACQRRGHRPHLHGLRASRRPRPGPGAPGGDQGRPAQVGPGDHRQQGLRLGHADGDHGRRSADAPAMPTSSSRAAWRSMTNAPVPAQEAPLAARASATTRPTTICSSTGSRTPMRKAARWAASPSAPPTNIS